MPIQTPRVSSRIDLIYLVAREFNAGLADIDQVLHNVLSATMASVGASDASLFLFDSAGDVERGLLINGFQVQKRQRPDLEAVLEQGLLRWMCQHRTGIVIKNTLTDERWFNDNDDPLFHKSGSAISVPIQFPDQLIGVLTITAPQTNHFDESDLAILNIIADQAAFAISNAELFKAEQHRRRLADTFASITKTINSSLNLKKVLELILEQLALVVDYDSSSVLLYEDDGNTLGVKAARGFEDMADALNVKLPFDENIPNYQAILLKQPVVIGDVDTDPYWKKSSSSQLVKSWIGAPLIARDEVVGMLTVDSHKARKYTNENVKVVAAFADYAATAVANAQFVGQLRNAEASYSSLFEDNTDMIIISNYEGFVLDVNRKACQVLRRHKDGLINLDIAYIDSQLPHYLAQHTKRLKVWREASFEVNVKNAYRQTVPLEFKVRQVQFRGKDCVQWVGRDISERKEIEKMREDMVNMLVHDLRGPLGNLINVIELISMMLGTPADVPKIKHFLEMAKRSGQTVNDLIDSMLDVSRLEQGDIPLQRTPTNISTLLQAVEDQVAPQAQAKQMQLDIQQPAETIEAWLDNSLIRRVLTNLVGNAIKYTPEEGHVALTTTLSNNKLLFTISDNGPGINKVDQARIFEKFSRVEQTGSAPGVGLGLAFCKLAVIAHDGKISVDSEGVPGKGSTFTVTLPLTPKSK